LGLNDQVVEELEYLGKLAFCVLKEKTLRVLLHTIFAALDEQQFGKLTTPFQKLMIGEIVMFFGQRAWEDLWYQFSALLAIT